MEMLSTDNIIKDIKKNSANKYPYCYEINLL